MFKSSQENPEREIYCQANKICGALKYFLIRCKNKSYNETGAFLSNQEKNGDQFLRSLKIFEKIKSFVTKII